MNDPQLAELFSNAFDFALLLIPVVLPFLLIKVFVSLWIEYVRTNFISKNEYTLLEIIPPQTMIKTPAAMELFLVALYQTSGESTWIDKYYLGKVRAWFSLEMVSIDGTFHFYIWTRKNLKKYIESQLYAEFPGLEMHEVDDYAKKVLKAHDGKHSIFGAELALVKPDPYPIKTYIDYGMDKEIEEERVIDPITPVVEFMSTLEKGHQAWIQIIVRAHRKEDTDPKSWFKKIDFWKETAASEIKKIQDESLVKEGDSVRTVNKTKGQEDRISSLERSVSKLSFDTGIRLMYVAENEVFDGLNIGGLIGTFKQYGADDRNSFFPNRVTDVDYPWQDISGRRVKMWKREMLEAYKERAYFFKKYPDIFGLNKRKYFILNTEELATIFHFPGITSQAPGLQKVKSKRAAPPANLPI